MLSPHLPHLVEFSQFGSLRIEIHRSSLARQAAWIDSIGQGVARQDADLAAGADRQILSFRGHAGKFLSIPFRQAGSVAILGSENIPLRDGEHRRGVGVVGIAAQRGEGQSHGRFVGSGRFGLASQSGQRRRLGADVILGDIEPFAAEQRQVDAVALAGIAEEFFDEGVVGVGLNGRNFQSQLILFDLSRVAFRRILQHEFQPGLMERPLHQEHRIAVAPQRRQPAGKHSQAGIGNVGREQRILRPEHRNHGQGADAAAGISGGDRFLGHQQHSAGGVGDRRQALPVDVGAYSQSGEADPFGAQDRQHTAEFSGVGPSQSGPVADIDDGAGGCGG